MTHRLFPSMDLHSWGYEITNGRCPRCHVHRFDILIERAEYDRLSIVRFDVVCRVG
jgi:hypothetical protein